MGKGIRFVTEERTLAIGRTLVVSDLHIGIEHRYRKKGISLPSQSETLMESLEKIIKQVRTRKLVIIGDVKHRVPGTSFQEEREIPVFFRRLLEIVEVEVVPGNHDGGIERLLPPGVVLHPSMGFVFGKTWLCHGHAWPSQEFLNAEHVVIGHNHAGIEFRDGLGYRWTEPVWVRAELDPEKLAEKYGKAKQPSGGRMEKDSLPEVVLMPPFNRFASFIPLNRKDREYDKHFSEGPSPLFRA
ncbi:MAG: metallophosphoesterase, partial [Candidatus Aenigmarchaeota archaeon]|nr:metallophosphoesterase [Candidatus Aenigmarchaeota archaeon]